MIYATYWREFYRKTYLEHSGKAIWDVDPTLSVGRDLKRFMAWMQSDLPLLDIGCGTGAPTAYLAGNFKTVIGIDTAEEAVAIARHTYPSLNMEFRCVDLADTKGCLDLHDEFGDLNLYMRGVLHQIKPEHKAMVVDNLATLMGKQGTFYFMEVASEIRQYFQEASKEFHRLPQSLQAIFISNLPPEGVSLEEIPQIFPKKRFQILDSGNDQLMTNISLPDGIQITIPAVYSIIRQV
jgi:SAM-dependent methyltransferase